MLARLIQIYVVGFILMMAYLLIDRDMDFGTALEPAALWPKTLYEMIDNEPVPT